MEGSVFSYITIIKIAISALAALLSVKWIYMRILRIAKTKNLVDNPEARKLQKKPVPVLGGIAVFFGLQAGLLIAACLFHDFYGLMPAIVAASIMLYIGTVDDITGLSPMFRFIIESFVILGIIFATGMCIDSFHGMWGIYEFSWWYGVPLTIFAGVGIINAFNMVDGVNGLSSGLCILVSTLLGVFFYKNGDPVSAVLAFCFAASLIPFFMHNVFGDKSRMFIGDGGTMVMGTLVSWFVIHVMSRDGLATTRENVDLPINMAAVLLAVVSVPVFDTLRVMFMRILRGQSPFSPDKTHLHHAYVGIGISHSITTLCELMMDMLVVGCWYVSYKLGASLDVQMYVTIAAGTIVVAGTYAFLRYQEKKDTELLHALQRFSIKTHLGHTDWWLRLSKRLDK